MVITRPQRYRDTLQAHYTSSIEIVTYMVSKLHLTDQDLIWEPCAGKGDLIDGILKLIPNANIRASEIDDSAIDVLRNKYKSQHNITVVHEDALELRNYSLFEKNHTFTRIIANPPYGAYQSFEKRSQLKKQYPSLYVRETYGVILYHALSLLQAQGRLVFIIPDTFLWLHRHDFLRRTLLSESTVEEVALFPSEFFPGINFGYSGLCIITVIKGHPCPNHQIRIIDKLSDPLVLLEIAHGQDPIDRCSISEIPQNDLLVRKHVELVRPSHNGSISLSKRANLTLADLAEVRTGFYSGNDRMWIRRASSDVPRSKHFQNVEPSRIYKSGEPPLTGISDEECFIPILRGGAAKLVRTTQWYVDWSVDAVSEYRRQGKNPARFQNSQYYFQEGIGVPMVASLCLTAALLEKRIFDQGIVGVFPKDNLLLKYLLGFLNTELATSLLRQINPTANNSANYLKRLPVVIPTSLELENCTKCVDKAIQEIHESSSVLVNTLNELEFLYRGIWCNGHPEPSFHP